MLIEKKNIKKVLEYILIFILFFIGIRKGGYYKQDSILGVCLIQIVGAIFFLINIKDIKKNSVVSLFLLLFSIAYFIPVFLDPASVSGSLNFASRIYTMYLIFCIVINSDSKEKYIKSIIAITIFFGILGIDEICGRSFNNILKLIGSGYLEDNLGQLSSVIQYANLMGILCVISIVYLIDKLQTTSYSKQKKVINYILIEFLEVVSFLTESKMVIFINILAILIVCIKNKKYKDIIENFIDVCIALVISSLCLKYNALLILIISILVFTLYKFLREKFNGKKYNLIIDIAIILAIVIVLIFNLQHIMQNDIITRIKDYFERFESTKLRLIYYIDSLRLVTRSFKEAMFGIGGNGFRTAYETIQNTKYISLETHSFFMQVLVEAGVVGLVAIILPLVYIFIKGKNNIYKLILAILVFYSAFDVFLTYSFMLFVMAILMGMCVDNVKPLNKGEYVINILLFTAVFLLSLSHVIASLLQPIEVDNLNNTLEEQEKIIQNCELSLKFDPYDIDYLNNCVVAYRNYLDIMDIKKELYGEDDELKRKKLVNRINKCINAELAYEDNNKYVLNYAVFYTLKYLDMLVNNNFSNTEEGYVYYLEFIQEKLNALKNTHTQNDLAQEMYNELLASTIHKYEEINFTLNSDKIKEMLYVLE